MSSRNPNLKRPSPSKPQNLSPRSSSPSRRRGRSRGRGRSPNPDAAPAAAAASGCVRRRTHRDVQAQEGRVAQPSAEPPTERLSPPSSRRGRRAGRARGAGGVDRADGVPPSQLCQPRTTSEARPTPSHPKPPASRSPDSRVPAEPAPVVSMPEDAARLLRRAEEQVQALEGAGRDRPAGRRPGHEPAEIARGRRRGPSQPPPSARVPSLRCPARQGAEPGGAAGLGEAAAGGGSADRVPPQVDALPAGRRTGGRTRGRPAHGGPAAARSAGRCPCDGQQALPPVEPVFVAPAPPPPATLIAGSALVAVVSRGPDPTTPPLSMIPNVTGAAAGGGARRPPGAGCCRSDRPCLQLRGEGRAGHRAVPHAGDTVPRDPERRARRLARARGRAPRRGAAEPHRACRGRGDPGGQAARPRAVHRRRARSRDPAGHRAVPGPESRLSRGRARRAATAMAVAARRGAHRAPRVRRLPVLATQRDLPGALGHRADAAHRAADRRGRRFSASAA